MKKIGRDTFHDSYMTAAWGLVAVFTLFRWAYSGWFLLAPDEANYWQWGRHLALGYHDQSPLIAWAIALSTWIFGHTERAVRLPSVLALAVGAGYCVAMAKRWVGARAAFMTAVLAHGIFEFSLGGLLATPDGLQAMAWAGAAYHVGAAYEKNKARDWLLGGFWFGLGFLAKLTMVIFPACAFLFGLCAKSVRPRLKQVLPYVSVGLGLCMSFPIVIWNTQNDWRSVRHVAHLGGVDENTAFTLRFLGDYLGAQLALVTPLVFVLMGMAWIWAVRKWRQNKNWVHGYLWAVSLPMVAGFALLSLHTRVYGNWPGAGYVTAAVLVTAWLFGADQNDSSFTRTGRRLWPWAVGTAYVMTALVLIQAAWAVFPVPAKLDRTATEIHGWDVLGAEAGQALAAMPNPNNSFVFGLRYQIASQLAFYIPGNPQTVCINKWNRPNVYDDWANDSDLLGMDAVGVTQDPDSHLTRLSKVFEKVEEPRPVYIHRSHGFSDPGKPGEVVRVFYIYRAFGFKGGLRWIPPAGHDIRSH